MQRRQRWLVGVLLAVTAWLAAGPAVIAQKTEIHAPGTLLAWPVSADPRLAQRLPLTTFDGQIAARVHLQRKIASVAIYDPHANRVYSGGEAGPIGGASLSKVLLAVIALGLLERRGAGEDELAAMRRLLYPMIAYSDNEIPNEIWRTIGGAGAIESLADAYRLPGIQAPSLRDWGMVSARASDRAVLFALLGSGRLLHAENTAAILAMMEGVIESHRWGVLTPGDDHDSYGKNGWFLDEETTFDWRVNSAGFVTIRDGDATTPRVVVVLTRYPGQAGKSVGIELATAITDRVIACTHIQQARATLSQRSGACMDPHQAAILMEVVRRIW